MVNEHSPAPGPIGKLIAFCAQNSLLVLFLTAAGAFWGYRALVTTPLDAIPDLSDVQVIVHTDWPGRSPDLLEDQITYPLTTTLLAAPKVRFVRGQSVMGSSFVYVIFEDGTDIYWARSRVIEYLNTALDKLPQGVRPTLGPDATGVGWIYQYALVDRSGRHSLADLRSFQDFTLRYWLEALEGVAEVASVGGFEKEYQVAVDPNRLTALGIPLERVARAIRRSNNDVGGRVLEMAGHEHFVRGRGYLRSTSEIEGIVLGRSDAGVPITVGNVADVSLGPAQRRGISELDGEGEAVGGIVVMRYGENALAVIERVKQRLAEARRALPQGMEIVPVYDRSALILEAVGTLSRTLVVEMAVVSLVILAFLLHFRSALVAILTLPVAILLAFIPMAGQGLTANIMSLGGIAVAIGAMVDASIVIIENIHQRLGQWEAGGRKGPRGRVVVAAMQEVGSSIFFSLLIITVSFFPVFALEGAEGRLFRPLAFTKTYSMGFAALLAVTFTPALAAILLRGRIRGDKGVLNRALVALYVPVVRLAVRWRWWVVGISLFAVAVTLPVLRLLGSEFMPPLNEGTILYMPTALPGISETEAGRVLQAMDRQLKAFPEVDRVFGKVGRSTSPTDTAPLSMVETVVTLKPQAQWRPGMTWDALLAEMDDTLRFPGMPNIWWMPIQTRTEMLATGIRSGLGIKVFGDDPARVEATAAAIERLLQEDPRTRPHTRSAFAERLTGGYFLDFDIDREKIARHGLTVADVQETLVAAVGGLIVTQTIEGRERYGVNLRYARDFRDDPEALRRVLVATPDGAQVPIGQLAQIEFRTGPAMLRNEDGQLVSFVFVDVTKLGIADYVDLARQAVAEKVALPPGYRLAWAGQFQHFERAKAKLKTLVPLTLAIVFLMLYLNSRSLVEASIIIITIPLSLIGAVWLLYGLNYNLSVAVWVGMIALAGLAAETGVIMLLYLRLSYDRYRAEGRLNTPGDLVDAIVDGSARRARPMFMTDLTLLLGVAPMLWSTGAGADVMKRIAAPLVGGTLTSVLLVLVVLPAVFAIWKEREIRPRF